MKITWSDDLSVGVDVIDKQHREFVGIINTLYDAIDKGNSRENVAPILKKLDEYAHYHFETEEKYFEEFNFDGAEEHIAEHKKLLSRLDHLIKEKEGNSPSVVIETLYFLEDWLKEHLVKMDHKYVECFHDNGLT